jgi:hypothetical protein
MKDLTSLTRRTGATFAAGAAAGRGLSDPARAGDLHRFESQPSLDPTRSADHSDAAVEALIDGGVRAPAIGTKHAAPYGGP